MNTAFLRVGYVIVSTFTDRLNKAHELLTVDYMTFANNCPFKDSLCLLKNIDL